MAHIPSQRALGPAGLMALGVLMIVAGGSVLAWLVYIGNSAAPDAERAMFRVGLAGAAMISAVAQLLIFVGGWTAWRARRRR